MHRLPEHATVAVDDRERRRRSVSSVVVLPAPFGPEQGDDLALVDVQVEVAHDRHAVVAGAEVSSIVEQRPLTWTPASVALVPTRRGRPR